MVSYLGVIYTAKMVGDAVWNVNSPPNWTPTYWTVTSGAAPAPAPSTGTIAAPAINVADRGDQYIQVGDYWFEDGVWGAAGLTRVPAGGYAGLTGSTYEHAIGVSQAIGPQGEVAGRMKWAVPTGTTEVKSYPSFIAGKKPGLGTLWTGAGGTPVYLADGSLGPTSPSGATPNTFFPLQLPLASLSGGFAFKHNAEPSGRGHLSYDIWLQNTPTQMHGFNSAHEITHEIMIPVTYWGNYGRSDRNADGTFGRNQGRNPGWYDSDATIDGRLFHIYRPHNPDGSFIPFGGGWRFIVFEPDQPMTPEQAQTLNLASFLNFLRTKGWAGSEWVSSVELGVETVEGTGDMSLYDYKVWR